MLVSLEASHGGRLTTLSGFFHGTCIGFLVSNIAKNLIVLRLPYSLKLGATTADTRQFVLSGYMLPYRFEYVPSCYISFGRGQRRGRVCRQAHRTAGGKQGWRGYR